MLKKLKEKKAYTLVEIVAVIVILGLLLLIAVPAVNKQLTNFRINYYKKLEQSVASAAKDFISDNSRKKPTKVFHSRVIKVSELEKDGYIDEVKDYIGKSCDNSDNSYSYVLVVKTGVKEYDYTTCLKCSQDEYATDTTGTKNNYCDIAWMTNEYIEYSMDEKYQKPLYIYYGTDQDSIIEQSKIYYDIIKENNDGSILATKVMDRADDTIVPSNVEELFNKELNTTINLKYILSDGEVLTRNGIIYKHNKPTVEMYYGNDNIYNGKTKNENYSNGEWANKLVVKFSFSDEDNTVTNDIDLKSIEYYDKESKNWQDTNCTLSEDKKSCTLEINNDLNSDMAFRVVNEYGYKGDASDYYTIQVDATKPVCELKASGTLGDDGWYISDVTLNFNQKTDDLSSIGNFDLTDSLTPTFNNRDEIVINIESGTKTYYGHVIDKAGNTNVCSKTINKN